MATDNPNPMDATGAVRRPITVLVAAGPVLNTAIERALRGNPDLDIVEAVDTIADGDRLIADRVPRLVVLGLELDRDPSGVAELCRRTSAPLPAVNIIVVAEVDWGKELSACVRAGAHATWLTRRSPTALDAAIVALERRRSCLTPRTAEHLLVAFDRLEADPTKVLAAAPALTGAERIVLRGLADGRSPSELATDQDVTTGTIGRYIAQAVAKLHRTRHDHELLRELA